MPALENPKHERFAQELAKGKTQVEAYEDAGYEPHDSAAARLFGNVRIAARVAEIQERAAIRTEVTVASITKRLLAIADKGETSTEAPLLSVARASLMDAAKLNGLVVDRAIKTEATLEELLDRIDGKAGEPSAPTH
jgi:phage terminase small subunit